MRELLQHALCLPDEVATAFEAEALERAVVQTPARFAHTARRLRERMHPESLRARRERALKDRQLTLSPERDGMAWLNLLVSAEQAQGIRARVGALAETAGDEDEEEAKRSRAQREADVATDLLLHGTLDETANRVGLRPTVHVTVPVLTLLGRSEEPAELEGYGPIDADTARRLCANAPSFFRILTHPVTGAYLSVGRESYRPPADLKRYLEVRDETCRFPGCNRRAVACDVDHIVPWARTKETSDANLVHLCRKHHRLKHQTQWRPTRLPGDVIRWTSPAGRVHDTHPARTLTPPSPPKVPPDDEPPPF